MTVELERSTAYRRWKQLDTALAVTTAKSWNLDYLLVCGAPVCKPGEHTTSLGGCDSCKEYEYYHKAARACRSDACEDNQIQLRDGKCATCPAYEYPDYTRRRCIVGSCGERATLNEDGSCNACPAYQRAQFNHNGVDEDMEAEKAAVRKGLKELGISEQETNDCVEKENTAACEKLEAAAFNSKTPAFQGEIARFVQ